MISMISRLLLALLLSVLVNGQLLSHSGKPKYHLVVDTDGGIDDMRSLSMLLAGNDIRVLAITCSQGTLLPGTVCMKVRSLLSSFHHQGIPVGTGEKTGADLPGLADFAEKLPWGEHVGTPDPDCGMHAVDLLNKTIENYPEKIILIALGTLKTYAGWLKANTGAAGKIRRIIWYNSHEIRGGFNYKGSPESYEYIRKCGIPLEVVASDDHELSAGMDYLNHIRDAGSRYAKQIERVYARRPAVENGCDSHFTLGGDLVPLYLTIPILFDIETENSIKFASVSRAVPADFVYEMTGRLLVSATRANNRVFRDFPVDTTLYKPAYANILRETVEKFGLIEWKAVSMTNEIHGHTGIYSIIGAKMGVRAMEYFNVGVNNLEVTTFAGSDPPLSCFNDGVQISTGATIGQGLIIVSDSISEIPSAIFGFNFQRVRISLKTNIAEQMQDEIKYGVKNYGLLTDSYWLYIENLAIQYWAGYDRQQIFVTEKL